MSDEIKPAFGKKVTKKSSGAGGLLALGIVGLLVVVAAVFLSLSM